MKDDGLKSCLLGRRLLPVPRMPFFSRHFASPFFGVSTFRTEQRIELESATNRLLSRDQNYIQRSRPYIQSMETISRHSTHSRASSSTCNPRRIKQPSKDARSRAKRHQHAQVPDTRIPNPEPCMHRRPDYAGP